jgi:pimeloyl-ACP methyl ester carboxylesterase
MAAHDAEPSLVLVHGAFHGAWCWERVVRHLAGRRIAATAVELPYTSYEDDLAAVLGAISAASGPVILVGHSLGGGLVCAAGGHPGVYRLGFLSAMVVDARQAVPERLAKHGVRAEYRSGATPELAAGMSVTSGAQIAVDREVAAAAFYSDCAADDAAAAVSRLRPASVSSMTGLPQSEPWREKPSSYVFCLQDRALPLDPARSTS